MVAVVSASADRHVGHPTEGSSVEFRFRPVRDPISNPIAVRETVAGGSPDFGIPPRDGQEENDS